MKIRIIQEEITSYVDDEKSYMGKCPMLKMEIKENSEFAFQFQVQKCVKSLLNERFCECNAPPKRLSKSAIMAKIISEKEKSEGK